LVIEILTPSSRAEWLGLRKSTLGASEVAAILSVHPWLTRYELFARKSGLVAAVEETPAMRRGRHLEAVAIDFLREERPTWIIMANAIPGGVFYRDQDEGLSCTPDALANCFPPKSGGQNFGVCQIKSVEPHVFKRTWVDDTGSVQAPLYVAIQAIQEAALTGASWACVGALVIGHGIDLHLIDIDLHAGLMNRIRNEAKDFWRRVRENDPYPPDFERDGDVIKSLYAEDSGGTIDLSGNEGIAKLAARHLALKEIESAAYAAKKEREIIDPEIIAALGNAQCGTINGLLIEAKTVRRHYKAAEAHTTSSRPVKIKQWKSYVTSERSNRGDGAQSAPITF
jgi:predicted phage-related endonuclease